MGRPAILKVDIIADAKGVGPGVSQAESKFSKFGSAAKKAGLIAGAGLALGLAAAGKAAFSMAKAAAEDEAAASRLANTLKNAAGASGKQVAATEDWITAQGKALGVADDELRPALGRLVTATHDVGKAQKLASLAMDISAGTGKSLEQVSTALMKAQNGQVGGLSKLGVATKDASGKTLSLDQITGNLAKTYKGAASTAANTAAGKWGRLKLQFGELKETIGAKLLPIASRLAGWVLNKMIPAAVRLGGQLKEKLGPAFRAVGSFITEKVIPAAGRFYHWFVDKIVPGIKKYVTPIIDGAREAFRKISDKIKDNSGNLSKLSGWFKKIAEFASKYILPIVGKQIGASFKTMGTIVGTVIDAISKLVGWLDSAIGKIKDLIHWIKNIKVPDIHLPSWAGGSEAGLMVASTPAREFATGAASPWPALLTTPTRGAAGGVYIDRRDMSTKIQVDGALDPAAVARQLERLLDQQRRRMGKAPVFS